MVTMMKWIMATMLVWCISASADPAHTELLKNYGDIYAKTIASYESEFRNEKQSWPVDYIKALQAYQGKLQALGDLDGWDLVNKELTRFRNEPKIGERVSDPAELRSLQDAFCSRADALTDEKSKKIVDLTDKYVSRLTILQREWTQSGDFNNAFAARDEIERVRSLEAVTAATDIVSKLEASKPEVEAEVPVPQNPWQPTQPTSQIITREDGTLIYPPKVMPPSVQGRVLSPKSLVDTKNSPWQNTVLVKVWDSSDRESDDFEKNKLVGSVEGKVSSDSRQVRVALQTTKQEIIKQNLEFIVEYYAKPASGSGDPRRVEVKRINVPYLDFQPTYIEIAPVTIDSLSRTVSVGPHWQRESTVGNKFYGYIVSAVDSERKLLYQGASSETLGKLATAPDENRMRVQEPRNPAEGGGERGQIESEYDAAKRELREAEAAVRKDFRNPRLREAVRTARERYQKAKQAKRHF